MAKITDLKFAYQVFMKAYPYRKVDWHPGARLEEPLSRARVAVVTTAAFFGPDQPPFDTTIRGGDYSYRVIPADTDLSTLEIAHRSGAFDIRGITSDKNLALPLDLLKSLAEQGLIGSAVWIPTETDSASSGEPSGLGNRGEQDSKSVAFSIILGKCITASSPTRRATLGQGYPRPSLTMRPTEDVTLCQPPNLSLANHVHRLISRDGSRHSIDGSEPQADRHPLLYEWEIPLQNIIQVGSGPTWAMPAQFATGLKLPDGLRVRGVPVYVDPARSDPAHSASGRL